MGLLLHTLLDFIDNMSCVYKDKVGCSRVRWSIVSSSEPKEPQFYMVRTVRFPAIKVNE